MGAKKKAQAALHFYPDVSEDALPFARRRHARRKRRRLAAVRLCAHNVSDDDSDGVAQPADDFDTVTDEVQRWATLDNKIIAEYRDDAGIVNEVMSPPHLI